MKHFHTLKFDAKLLSRDEVLHRVAAEPTGFCEQ